MFCGGVRRADGPSRFLLGPGGARTCTRWVRSSPCPRTSPRPPRSSQAIVSQTVAVTRCVALLFARRLLWNLDRHSHSALACLLTLSEKRWYTPGRVATFFGGNNFARESSSTPQIRLRHLNRCHFDLGVRIPARNVERVACRYGKYISSPRSYSAHDKRIISAFMTMRIVMSIWPLVDSNIKSIISGIHARHIYYR